VSATISTAFAVLWGRRKNHFVQANSDDCRRKPAMRFGSLNCTQWADAAGFSAALAISTITTIGSISNWDDLADGAKTIRGYNFQPNAYIISPATYKMFDYLKDTLYQPLRPQSSLDGVVPLLTNQAASGYYYMGQFDQMAMGLRAGMRLEVSREGFYVAGETLTSAFSKDQTLFRLVLRADFQRLHPRAFCVGSGITVS
jgi:HK97 family phage major capsid protein